MAWLDDGLSVSIEVFSATSGEHFVLEKGQDEGGAGDLADSAGAGGDALQRLPALVEQGEAALDLLYRGLRVPPGHLLPCPRVSPHARYVTFAGFTATEKTSLRIEEALAVEKADFRDNGTILRMYQQATRDGRETAPLKKRKRGEYRDIPVPRWLWDMIRDLPDGPLMIGNGERRYHL